MIHEGTSKKPSPAHNFFCTKTPKNPPKSPKNFRKCSAQLQHFRQISSAFFLSFSNLRLVLLSAMTKESHPIQEGCGPRTTLGISRGRPPWKRALGEKRCPETPRFLLLLSYLSRESICRTRPLGFHSTSGSTLFLLYTQFSNSSASFLELRWKPQDLLGA